MKPGNILEIESLHDAWCDKDYVLLHACFQLLTNCIEEEELLKGHVDWNADEKHRKAKKELTVLYEWWVKRSKMVGFKEDATEKQYNEDNKMLHRLIDIRWALWT